MKLQSPPPVRPEQPQGRTLQREVVRIRESVEVGPGMQHRVMWPTAVHCERCGGLLHRIQLQDWGGGRGQGSGDALQCIACGDIIDPVIVRNRRGSGQLHGVRRKTREGQPRVAIAF